jgi:hypothetical protein
MGQNLGSRNKLQLTSSVLQTGVMPVTVRLAMPLHPLLQKRWLQVLPLRLEPPVLVLVIPHCLHNDGGARCPLAVLNGEESKKDRKGKWAKFWKGKDKATQGKGNGVGKEKDKKSGKWLKFRSTRAERWSSGC